MKMNLRPACFQAMIAIMEKDHVAGVFEIIRQMDVLLRSHIDLGNDKTLYWTAEDNFGRGTDKWGGQVEVTLHLLAVEPIGNVFAPMEFGQSLYLNSYREIVQGTVAIHIRPTGLDVYSWMQEKGIDAAVDGILFRFNQAIPQILLRPYETKKEELSVK